MGYLGCNSIDELRERAQFVEITSAEVGESHLHDVHIVKEAPNYRVEQQVHERILILDFGAQYTQLIARRVRENCVYCEIHPYDVSDAFVREFAPRGIILSGGPASVTEDSTPRAPQAVFECDIPVLGICYGMQAMAAQLGGAIESTRVREFGYAELRAHGHSALLRDIEDRSNDAGHGLLDVWMSHGDDFHRAFLAYQAQRMNRTARVVLSSRFFGAFIHASGGARALRNELLAKRSWDDLWEIDWLYRGIQIPD